MLSPNLLGLLREWWRAARQKGWMHPGQPWLFPGYRGQHTSTRQLHRIFAWQRGVPASPNASVLTHTAAQLCHPSTGAKDRYPRHSEPAPAKAGVLLGHKKLDTTALYTRLAINAIGEVTSPLDLLLSEVKPPA